MRSNIGKSLCGGNEPDEREAAGLAPTSPVHKGLLTMAWSDTPKTPGFFHRSEGLTDDGHGGSREGLMRISSCVLLLAALVGLGGCGSSPGTRAVTGGLMGAGAGAGIAAVTGGRPATGALIGSGVGAVGGAVTR